MRTIILFTIAFVCTFFASTQSDDAIIIFTHDGRLRAQSTNGGDVINIGLIKEDFDTILPSLDVYTLSSAPINRSLNDGYGFHHGVWSIDKTQFVYIEVNPPQYRIRLIANNADTVIMSGEISENLAYLDPVRILPDGRILLLERQSLGHLHRVNMFIVRPEPLELDFFTAVQTGHLVGGTALLPDGIRVFLGFDFEAASGIIINTANGQLERFPVNYPHQSKGFDHSHINVYGAINQTDMIDYAQTLTARPTQSDQQTRPQPFLHWPLADNYRDITCYPDSDWTYSNFTTTCPGLAGRNYEGHQGTDVSQEPDALLIGTPIYPSAVGTVVHAYRDCLGVNPSCNNAYGNTMTMEHILVVNGETQIWYTGYGHLQMPLIEIPSYIDDLTQPIALSGSTGIGGPHLHFEVRTPHRWVDPWDDREQNSLWIGGNNRPLAIVASIDETSVPRVIDVCTSYAQNNIRSGAGTTYDNLGQTVDGTTYYIISVENVQTGDAIGDWYEVLYEGGQGWLWSGVMNCP